MRWIVLRYQSEENTSHEIPLYEAIKRVGEKYKHWFTGVELQPDDETRSDKFYKTPDAAVKLINFKCVKDYLVCVDERTEHTFEDLPKNWSIFMMRLIPNTMNIVRFRWQVLDGGSQVRNIKWVKNKGKDFASLREVSRKCEQREVISFLDQF